MGYEHSFFLSAREAGYIYEALKDYIEEYKEYVIYSEKTGKINLTAIKQHIAECKNLLKTFEPYRFETAKANDENS